MTEPDSALDESSMRYFPSVAYARETIDDLEALRRDIIATIAVNHVTRGDWHAWASRLGTLTVQLGMKVSTIARDLRSLDRELERERTVFPAEGVFLVEHGSGGKSYMRIAQLGELPDPLPLAAIMRHHMAITQAVRASWELYQERGQQSPWDVAEAIMRAVADRTTGEFVPPF